MQKKYELTAEHRSKFPEWRDKWIKVAMRADRLTEEEKETVAIAIHGLYSASGLKAPRIVFVASPIQASLVAALGLVVTESATKDSTIAETRDSTIAETRDSTLVATTSATESATWDATTSAVWDETWYETWDAVLGATESATLAATRDSMRGSTRAATESATWATTRDSTIAATRDEAWDETMAATRDATEAETWVATWDETMAATIAATRAATWAATWDVARVAAWDETMAATIAATWCVSPYSSGLNTFCRKLGLDTETVVSAWKASHLMSQMGKEGAPSIALISFFRHIAKLDIDYQNWQHWENAAIASVRYMHPEFCIVSDNPIKLLVDEQNRPHCADGPFCEWADGAKLYSWHGVRVPAWAIEQKELISKDSILGESNPEIRRALCEMVGWEAALLMFDGITIDQDECLGLPRRLLSVDQIQSRILVVQNGSLESDGSRRQFVLAVPDSVTTCHEAVAWSYGLSVDVYSEGVRA